MSILRPNPRTLIDKFRVTEVDSGFAPGGSSLLIDSDPSRIALIFSIVSGSTLSLGVTPGVLPGTGLQLPIGLAPYMLTFHDIGAIVGGPWYGIAVGLAGSVHIMSVTYNPDVGG